jgi:hypothetical protein
MSTSRPRPWHALLRGLPVLVGLALPLAAAAAEAGDERARIQAERKVLEDQFAREREACSRQFAVTSCVQASRLREREAVGSLRARLHALDEATLRERAGARQAEIERNRRRAAATPPRAASAPAMRAQLAPVPRPDAAASKVEAVESAAARRADAASRNAQAARLRRERAQETQDRIAARQAERVRQGKVPAALPTPPAP